MTYREMRNFTEMMRSLGYNRLISMENFRTPNFPLTAEILTWLVYRYDQNADVSQNIDTEQDRVIFVKMVAHFMMTKAHIKLNTKRLYQADGYAVRELLKVTTLLYNSMRSNRMKDSNELNVNDILDANKLKEIKDTRQLASQIISKGATLSDFLRREIDLREARAIALSNQLEIAEVDRAIQKSIEGINAEKQKQTVALNNIASDEANLDLRLEKKRGELERNQKRLSTLQSVRPAYMDEYEQLEEELSVLYSAYLTSFRNQAYLESQYEDFVRQQLDRSDDKEITLKKMADELRKAENVVSNQFSGKPNTKKNKDDFENLLDNDDEDDSSEPEVNETDFLSDKKSQSRGAPAASGDMKNGTKQTMNAQRNFGTMRDDESEEDDDDDDDDDDESEDESDDIDENSEESENHMEKGRGNNMNPHEHSLYNNSANMAGGAGGFARPRGAEYNNKSSKTRGRVPSEPEDDF